MSNYELTIHSNPDAQAWAKFFIHTKEEKNWQIKDIDEPLMLAWFANAMMAMHDHLKSQRTWVGLTDEDKHEIELRAGITEDDDGYIVSQVFKLTEAKLKEKNT